MAYQDLTGKVVHRLTVLRFSHQDPRHQVFWLCACSCGKTTVQSTSHLNSGKIHSCGCKNDESRRNKHGTLADRFWKQVDKTETCWIWKGSTAKGYGRPKYKGRKYSAHRLAWEYTKGPIPEGLNVLHSCDNPPCVNPDHLFLGTDLDNMRDKMKKGRWKGNSKVTPEQVVEIRQLYVSGKKQKDIAPLFGIKQAQVSAIVRRPQ